MEVYIKQELQCAECKSTIVTTLSTIAGLELGLVVTTCPYTECKNHGEVLLLLPPTLSHQTWRQIGRGVMPGTPADGIRIGFGGFAPVGGKK